MEGKQPAAHRPAGVEAAPRPTLLGLDRRALLSWLVVVASVSVAALGAVVLLGWALGVESLELVSLGSPAMLPNTAAGFIVAGASLFALRREEARGTLVERAGRLGGVLLALLGGLVVSEYVLGWDLGIDLLVLSAPAEHPALFPGRPAPNTAVSFVLLGLSLALLPIETRRGRAPSELLAVLTALVAFVGFTGHVLGVDAFYGLPWLLPHTGMALHTSIAFLVASIGVLAARPGRGWMATLLGPSPGGSLLRHALPIVIAAPLVIGRLVLWGEDLDLYELHVTLALISTTITVSFGALMGVSATRLNRMQAELARAFAAECGLRAQVESLGRASDAIADAVANVPRSEMQALLQMIVLQAQAITRADFAALGIGERHGDPFEPWVFSGVREEQAAAIGRMPRALGVLGAVVRDGQLLRTADVRKEREFRGFPPGHPEMAGFLGVPIQFHGRRLGHLYLANGPDRSSFTGDDERLVELYADRVAAAMETARLYRAKELEQRWLQSVIDSMPEGVVLLGADGAITRVNQAARRLACDGAGERDPLGNPVLFDLRRPNGEPVPWDERPMARAFVARETVTGMDAALRRADGALVPVLASASPIMAQDGSIAGAVAVFQDIALIKELERQRQEWISVVAHDLRQPMGVIAMSAYLLERHCKGMLSERDHKTLERIGPSVQRLNRMIEDLLDASRIEAKALKLEREELDLAALLPEVVERAASVTGGHPVLLDIEGGAPPILADPGRIEQIVTNLLSNAAKYGERGAAIIIHLGAEGGEAHVSVENSGPGIPAHEIPLLFARFSRMPSAEQRKIRGIGLGLYIVKGLVEAHGGRIWVHSRPGESTTFHFVLPAARAAEKASAA